MKPIWRFPAVRRWFQQTVLKRKEAKHNPLQRLTYLSLATFLLPFQMITGFALMMPFKQSMTDW